MSVYSLFNSSTLAMMSQAHSLNVIGQNIANISTGGYKKTDAEFRTILGKTLFEQSDIGGVRPKDLQRIDTQGLVVTSERDLDLAIDGQGFFAVSPTLVVSSQIFFTRDGSFEISADNPTVTTDAATGATSTSYKGYLIDKNGHYLLGWSPNATGVFTNTGTVAPMRVDPAAFQNVGRPSTAADLDLNLPANNAIIASHATAVTNFNAGTTTPGMETYNIKVYDSNGSKQNVRLNFTKSAVNTWQMSTTTQRNPVAQIDTVTIAGTVEALDTYTVTINGNAYLYTVTGAEGSLATIRTALVNLINADTGLSVTASAGAAPGAIVLTADTAGSPFTTLAAAVNNGVSVAQVDRVTIAGTVEAGDVYSVTINGTTVSYTVTGGEANINVVRSNLRAAINANATLGPLVTAADGGAGQINITSDTAGVALTTTTAATNNGVTADNTSVAATITANVTAANNNTAAVANTTANVTAFLNGATTAIPFTAFGLAGTPAPGQPNNVTPPTPLNLALTFAAFGGNAAGTASFTLDIAGLTQFAAGLQPIAYNIDGFQRSSLVDVTFDQSGHVIGRFESGESLPIYKVPLALFSNPNGLEMRNGMVFAESETSGTYRYVAADVSDAANFLPNSHELSNVDIGEEFTRMILTQQAYNSAATVFRTVDEMTVVARDLKR